MQMVRAWHGGFLADFVVQNPGNSTHNVSEWELEITFPRQVFSLDVSIVITRVFH